MKQSMLFSLMMLLTLNAFAKADEAMIIRNDIDENIVAINIVSDDSGKFTEMRKIQTSSAKKVLADETFNVSALNKGATVLVRKGRDVVKIKFSSNFDPMYGGTFQFDYLYNGVSGSRKQIELDLRKNGARWEVTRGNRVAKKLNVIAKRAAIVGPIGIEEIRFEN